jgi:hypothetical protein
MFNSWLIGRSAGHANSLDAGFRHPLNSSHVAKIFPRAVATTKALHATPAAEISAR